LGKKGEKDMTKITYEGPKTDEMPYEILPYKAKTVNGNLWVRGAYMCYYPNTESPMDPSPSASEYKHVIIAPRSTDWNLPKVLEEHDVQPGTICRFAHMFDENLTPIYEHDIISYKNKTYEVRFSNGMFMAFDQPNNFSLGDYILLYEIADVCKVVGNIIDGI
jgi:hypothetical protein